MNCSDPLIESGMTFGPFPGGSCFPIEQSASYQAIEAGVKMAEFLLLRQTEGDSPVVWIVEAKSSSPRPQSRADFDDFIEEIRQKLSNALSLGLAACLGRHPAAETELSDSFRNLALGTVSFRLVLVINGHQDAWLPPLNEALSSALHSVVKTWALPPTAVTVMNDGMARDYGLIQ
jgi:hypothetical protein